MVQYISLIILALLIQLYFRKKHHQGQNKAREITVLLGSGGHTTQICMLLKNFRFEEVNKVNVIVTSTDKLSQQFFLQYFQPILSEENLRKCRFIKTTRTNQVKQSKFTSIFTTFLAGFHAIYIVLKQLRTTTHLIANGPGFCVPFFLIFFLLNKLKVTKAKLIFIESWCRVQTLSTTGKIVKYITDEYLVHWEKQKNLFKGIRYQGQLI